MLACQPAATIVERGNGRRIVEGRNFGGGDVLIIELGLVEAKL